MREGLARAANIVLFCDPTLLLQRARPSAEELALIAQPERIMASKKRQRPTSSQGASMGSSSAGSYSYGPPGGVFGLSPPEVSLSRRDGRKKRKDVLSLDKYTYTPYFDGHLWRKYGQKRIKNTPFPRLYFRCSYSGDTHCMASKLTQQVSHGDPPLYKVTYMHEHTCNAERVPTPDVVGEAELPAAANDGLVLRFGSYGMDHHRDDARMRQEQSQYHQPMYWSSFELLSFDSWNNQLQQQPVLFSDVPPPPAVSSSSSFPIAEPLPTLPATNSEGDVLPMWNSFMNGIEDHLHFDNHADFPGDMFTWDANMDVHTCIHNWACTVLEGQESYFF